MSNVWVMLLVVPIGGLAASGWALLDVLLRPALVFRVAGISKRRRVLWFTFLAVAISLAVAIVGLGRPDHFLGLGCFFSGEVFGVIGIDLAGWYLLIERKWVSAQLRFAQRGLARG
jgi:formate-dependent nitrite reductase membrane component NrfD